jgi:hypothetical protein
MRTGPVTKDSTTIALGLAQIRVGSSATYIGQVKAILTSASSIGALANTKFTGSAEYFKLFSGYPLLEDASYPLRESSMMEVGFKEITPKNFALARGLDPASYTQAHYGQIPLGTLQTPASIRMEAVYTYPDGTNTMTIIFPRAQVTASIEMEFAEEEPAAVAVAIEAKRADSEIAGGSTAWDNKPLGVVIWNDGTTATTTSTTTTTTAP